MRASSTLLVGTLVVASACVPDLNGKASRVDQTRTVAVRATPAEATPGQKVSWQAIIVSPLMPQAATQVDWAMCEAPRNPSDSITVTAACFGDPGSGMTDAGVPLVTAIPAQGASASGTIPSDACRRIGPEVSGMSATGVKQRPPDPDITGGYQLPIRVVISDPTGGDGRVDVAFDRQRVKCNIASAPADAAALYAKEYTLNNNPDIQSVVLGGNAGPPNAHYAVPPGSKVPISITWDPSAQETYVLFDPISRQIEQRSENLDVAWYTNGGEFDHDRTTQDKGASSSSNTLTVDKDVAQMITVWIVLRDDRGGVGTGTLFIDPS